MKLTDLPDLAKFIATHPAATIAVPIDAVGTLHAAAIMYSSSPNPLELYFITSRNSQKCTLIHTQSSVPCAAVIGTEKHTPYTVQLRGTLAEIDPAKYPSQLQAYYTKRGNQNDSLNSPDACVLKFTPTWARFTSYNPTRETHILELQ